MPSSALFQVPLACVAIHPARLVPTRSFRAARPALIVVRRSVTATLGHCPVAAVPPPWKSGAARSPIHNPLVAGGAPAGRAGVVCFASDGGGNGGDGGADGRNMPVGDREATATGSGGRGGQASWGGGGLFFFWSCPPHWHRAAARWPRRWMTPFDLRSGCPTQLAARRLRSTRWRWCWPPRPLAFPPKKWAGIHRTLRSGRVLLVVSVDHIKSETDSALALAATWPSAALEEEQNLAAARQIDQVLSLRVPGCQRHA